MRISDEGVDGSLLRGSKCSLGCVELVLRWVSGWWSAHLEENSAFRAKGTIAIESKQTQGVVPLVGLSQCLTFLHGFKGPCVAVGFQGIHDDGGLDLLPRESD